MMELGSLKASDVGLGAWQAGGRAWTVDRAELLKAYRRAFELGINFVDTAEKCSSTQPYWTTYSTCLPCSS